jgi:NAD(P)H dehydrogenase (quinone)
MNKSKILVTGASGQLGVLVLEGLLKKGITNTIATTRTPESLSQFAGTGIEVRSADFGDPASLEQAFAGAERMLLISSSDLASQVQQHKAAIDAAKKIGVKYIAYTSGPNPEKSPAVTAAGHWTTEQYLKQSGVDYTFLRNYPYVEVLYLTLPTTIQCGEFLGTAGKGKVAYVTREDCADAAVGVLTSDAFKNMTLDVTGPQAHSHSDIVEIISSIIGEDLRYIDLEAEALKSRLVERGFNGFWPDALISFDLAYRQGDTQSTSDAVLKLSGHQPQSVADYFKANAARLRK